MLQLAFKWFVRLFLFALGFFLLTMCGFLALLSSGELLAQAIAPPEYPDSDLISQWRSGGSTSMWDKRTYHTNDDVDSVLYFYENHMPGFREFLYPEDAEIAYGNRVCNESILANILGSTSKYEFDDDPFLPCVSVRLIPDSEERESGTQIKVSFEWPAP